MKVVWLPKIVIGTDTIGKCGKESWGPLGLGSVMGALAVKVVSLLEIVMGTDTIGNILWVLLGTLTDTGTDAVKVVWPLTTVIGTDTTDTVEGMPETGLVSVVDAVPDPWELVPVVDADSDPWALVWPPGRLIEMGRLPEVGNGTIAAGVDVSADCPVLDDA